MEEALTQCKGEPLAVPLALNMPQGNSKKDRAPVSDRLGDTFNEATRGPSTHEGDAKMHCEALREPAAEGDLLVLPLALPAVAPLALA